MKTARIILYWVGAMAVWLLLTWTVHWQSVLIGAFVTLLTALVFGSQLPMVPARVFNPRRWFWVLVYIPVFAWHVFKANVDVAMRVLSPGMALNPGIIKIHTSLRTDIARTFLANSITLTPGTMTVEIKDDILYIHWIDVKSEDPEAAARIIKGPFEKILAQIFD
jgi:multicomponent Na+:H+ antiporter subunit E